jgi:hypothetical protein
LTGGLAKADARAETPGDAPAPPPAARWRRRGLRLLPWLVALPLLAWLIARLPWPVLRQAWVDGAHLGLAAYCLGGCAGSLVLDAVATRVAMRRLGVDRPLSEVLLARTAANLPGLLGYAGAQAGFGLYLAQVAGGWRKAGGAVLFILATAASAVLAAALVAVWLLHDLAALRSWSLALAAAGVAWVALLPWLARLQGRLDFLAPLGRAGRRGHLIAVAARLPHLVWLAAFSWGAYRLWDVDVPFVTGVGLSFVVLLIAAVPITPSGLGTAQAAAVFLFAPYAGGGATGEAKILAVGLAAVVYSLLWQVLLAFASLGPLLRRLPVAAGRRP